MDRMDDDRNAARRAAKRPRMPALPLWVWTMSGRVFRKRVSNWRQASQSCQGATGRTSVGWS